jgi:osmotically-inducible protein OsmY
MKSLYSPGILANLLILGAAVGSVGLSAPSVAQVAQVAAPAAQSTDAVTDAQLRQRIQDAMHADPYFNDAHVTVSVDKGVVVLGGFVTTDWDLRDAIRIANNTAGGRRVVDNISLKLGGSR